jgi:hypothetical protein
VAFAVAALVCSPVQARSIPDAPNEVDDPWFEGPFDDPYFGWHFSPPLGQPYPTVTPFTDGTLFGGYLDPGRTPGSKVIARTIVDNYDGLWNPMYNNKEIDLCFYAHLDGDGYVNVRFDWWDDQTMDRPPNYPDWTPEPDGWTDWYTLTKDDPGLFEMRPDLVLPDENLGWFLDEGEGPYCFHDIWDHQPRWVSIEFEVGILPGSTIGGEAFITGIDFESRCVPEPSMILLLVSSGIGLLVCAWRRRRTV